MTERDTRRLESLIGTVLRAGVVSSTICLSIGLLLFFLGAASAALFLQLGIVLLLITPVTRVVVSIAEYAIEHDWTFMVLTLIVLGELAASLIAAVYGRKL
jgi:uncharacterized membrane protein